MLSFKQRHFKQDMILMLVRRYVAYALSYRDIEELAGERGLEVDHSTINPAILGEPIFVYCVNFNRARPALLLSVQQTNHVQASF